MKKINNNKIINIKYIDNPEMVWDDILNQLAPPFAKYRFPELNVDPIKVEFSEEQTQC